MHFWNFDSLKKLHQHYFGITSWLLGLALLLLLHPRKELNDPVRPDSIARTMFFDVRRAVSRSNSFVSRLACGEGVEDGFLRSAR